MIRWLATCVAFALVGLLPLELDAAEHCPDCLRAGAATAALRVPAGAPLAGYGSGSRRLALPDVLGLYPHAFWFKPNAGELDPVMARALVVLKGAVKLVLVTVDLVAVDGAFTRLVKARLGTGGANDVTLVIAASHTHSGPGAFVDSRLMGFIAVDRLDRELRDALVDTIIGAVRQAERVTRPARIGVSSLTVPGLTVARLPRPVDPELIGVKIVADIGTPIALVWNLAIHGTVLGARNRRLSGDVMGLASRLVETELGIPALFVNGAVADVSPHRHGREGALATSRELATWVRRAWDEAVVGDRAALAIRTREVRVGAPYLSVRNCVGSWLPRLVAIPLAPAFPEGGEMIAVDLGPLVWVTIPGELQSALGQRIKQSARPRWPHVMIAGLANDYLGYFVTAEDYDRASYVTCANLYGPDAGDELTRAATAVLQELGSERTRNAGDARR